MLPTRLHIVHIDVDLGYHRRAILAATSVVTEIFGQFVALYTIVEEYIIVQEVIYDYANINIHY